MGSAASIFVTLGGLLVCSILADTLSRRSGLPRISLLVLVGVAFAAVWQFALGYEAARPLGALGDPLVTLALVMVAFLLGGDLTFERLRAMGRPIFVISIAVAVTSALMVALGLFALGFSLALAILLGAIATATDPAAVREVARGMTQTSDRIRLTLGIVAIDDAWGVLAFGLGLAAVGLFTAGDGLSALAVAGWELAGAVILGVAIGLPAAWLSGRLQPGEPTQAEALAIVLLIAGLSSWLEVSPLLAGIVAGIAVANRAPHHTRSFREIENIEWPFLVFFFVLAGASLDFSRAGEAIPLAAAYIVFRLLGRGLGGWAGTCLAKTDSQTAPRTLGLALTPQAGVAMGMALLAAESHPGLAGDLVAAAVLSTVLFELTGPMATRYVLRSLASPPS